MAKSIGWEKLKEKMDRGNDFVLIEVLAPDAYKKAHIKGAINIPLERIGH